MSEIGSDKYAGGRDLVSEDGLARDLQEIADDLATLRDVATGAAVVNKVVEGLLASAPSTPSSQAAGTGNTTWRANLSAGVVVVDSVEKAETAQADFSIHSGSMLVAASQEVVARIVEQNHGGVLSTVAVKGTAVASTTGATAPSDAAVQAALATPATDTWVELCRIRLARDAGVTLTATYDHSHRGAPAASAAALSTTRG